MAIGLTRSKILAQLAAGYSVNIKNIEYTKANADALPSDAELQTIYGARSPEATAVHDKQLHIEAGAPSASAGNAGDVWLDHETGAYWQKVEGLGWHVAFISPPPAPPPNLGLNDLTDVDIEVALVSGNPLAYDSVAASWGPYPGSVIVYRGTWVANSFLTQTYSMGSLVKVVSGPTTTFYLYVHATPGRQSAPATDDGATWQAL